jgi:hypothetical protein
LWLLPPNTPLPHPPGALLQAPGERWFQAGRISQEASRTGAVLSGCAVPAVFGKDVLIPFHPLSMAVSCLQASGGRFVKLEPLCGPSPHMCSSIHPVLDPFVSRPTPLQWHLTPPRCPTFPSISGSQQARPGMCQPSPL